MKYVLILFISLMPIICLCKNLYFPPKEGHTYEIAPLDELG